MKLVLSRHGQSEWNLSNRFTGWVDVDLTAQGVEEAVAGGKLLKEKGILFDVAFTSIKTLHLLLEYCDQLWIPEYKSWRLNERHYGGLQGLNKAETAAKYGDEQVHIWRRSFDVPPPAVEKTSEYYPANERRYREVPADEMPVGESLKDTIARVLPYWDSNIAPELRQGKNVLISAHGNSLRALIKYLLNISDEKILELNLPTGTPLIFDLDDKLNIVSAPELF